jgi:hypothetical protein
VSSQTLDPASQDTEEDHGGPTRQEGELYLSTPCVRGLNSSGILPWWKENESTYPRLAQVVKDILAIPIAQVGVERVFNMAKDVIGDRRHRLAAQTIQKIMVLKDDILQEAEQPTQLPDADRDEDQAPCDEVDDLFELTADFEPDMTSDEEEEEVGIMEEEPEVERLPPRKRQRPSRYRD